MAHTIFYSWQSDLPNPTNRGFIQAALEAATKTLREDGSIQVDPVVDRDTAGVPGSPDISSTILRKIEEAAVFVCDVSIINQGDKEVTRLTPNPNILIELGYAMKALGQERIIMVMNAAFGIAEKLPFDLRQKRVLTYNAPPGTVERAEARKKLQGALEYCLRDILRIPPKKPETDVGQDVEIAAPGRWLSRKDRLGEVFGHRTQGQRTPATVRVKPQELYLFSADIGVTDRELGGLMLLAKYIEFRNLKLYNCKHLTESGLCSLQAFRHLWELDLANTKTTDKVLESLRQLTLLQVLNVQGCGVSSIAVEQLREALPSCKVLA